MKKLFLIAAVAVTLISGSGTVFAQGSDSKEPSYYGSITVNSDAFFGLTPIAAVGVPLTDSIDLTGYAIFWSGIGNNSLFGHWTEFGGGVNFSLMEGALNVNPQIGILNGNLLSRGGGSAPIFAEGVVPNLTVFFEQFGFEMEFYYGYYIGTKADTGAKTTPAGVTFHKSIDPSIALLASIPEGSQALGALGLDKGMFPNKNARNNFTHFWFFPGYQITDWLSIGLHFEELQSRPSGGAFDSNSVLYKWQGAYITFKAGKGTLRVAGGNSSATVAGPDASQILEFLADGQSYIDYLATPESPNAMNGTYYRVTYTQEF